MFKTLKDKIIFTLQNERGSMGIKEIAFMVAAIVIIGSIVMAVTGFMPDWIEQVWEMLIDYIDNVIGSN